MNGQVNNYVIPAFGKAGAAGAFSGSGTHYTLDFGSSMAGPGFSVSGNAPFSNLAVGRSQGGLNVLLSSATIGSFLETIDLSAIGHNASGYSAGSIGVLEPAS